MEMNGWKFQTSSQGTVQMFDDRGVKYASTIMMGGQKVLIQKTGTTRLVRFPKFVIDFVLAEAKKATGNDNLIVVNKAK